MFPTFEFVFPLMSVLPVQMVAMILGFLSPESQHFIKVCRDSILREIIRAQTKKKKELRLKAIIDAKGGIVVIRKDPPKIFNPNVQKSIKREYAKRMTVYSSSGSKGTEARFLDVVSEALRPKGEGKLRRPRKERTGPHKTFRC